MEHARSCAERPRERLLALGPAALTDAELLAVMLRTGVADEPNGHPVPRTGRAVALLRGGV